MLSVLIGTIIVAIPEQTVGLTHKLSAIQALALGTVFIILGFYLMLKGNKNEGWIHRARSH